MNIAAYVVNPSPLPLADDRSSLALRQGMNLLFASLLLLDHLSNGLAQNSTVFERTVGDFKFVSVTTDGELTPESLKKFYFHYSALQKEEVFQLRVMTDPAKAAHLLGGKLGTDRDRADIVTDYNAYKGLRESFRMGEVVRVGRNAVMRIISDNKFTQEVISGANPFKCKSPDNTCEILWISIGRVPPSEPHYSQPMVNLYVLLEQLPTLDEARSLFLSLRKRFPTKLLEVAFRADIWFIDDLEFPLVYPFFLPGHDEDITGSDARKEVLCLENTSGVTCR